MVQDTSVSYCSFYTIILCLRPSAGNPVKFSLERWGRGRTRERQWSDELITLLMGAANFAYWSPPTLSRIFLPSCLLQIGLCKLVSRIPRRDSLHMNKPCKFTYKVVRLYRFWGDVPPPPNYRFHLREISIGKIKNSNSSNGIWIALPPTILSPPIFWIRDRLWSICIYIWVMNRCTLLHILAIHWPRGDLSLSLLCAPKITKVAQWIAHENSAQL